MTDDELTQLWLYHGNLKRRADGEMIYVHTSDFANPGDVSTAARSIPEQHLPPLPDGTRPTNQRRPRTDPEGARAILRAAQ